MSSVSISASTVLRAARREVAALCFFSNPADPDTWYAALDTAARCLHASCFVHLAAATALEHAAARAGYPTLAHCRDRSALLKIGRCAARLLTPQGGCAAWRCARKIAITQHQAGLARALGRKPRNRTILAAVQVRLGLITVEELPARDRRRLLHGRHRQVARRCRTWR